MGGIRPKGPQSYLKMLLKCRYCKILADAFPKEHFLFFCYDNLH